MQKNETTLTPIYRYMLELIESNGREQIAKTANVFSKFQEEWNRQEQITHEKIGFQLDAQIFDILKNLLEKYQINQDAAQQFWQEKKSALANEKTYMGSEPSTEIKKCNLCQPCYNCQLYFWEELGELFFGISNLQKESGQYFPIRSLPEKIARHLEPSVGMADMYCANVRRRDIDVTNKLVVLKGMSSSTPATLNNIFDTDKFDGGGHFLNLGGYGVVIDPGYHFMKNLHHFGLNVFDIQAVIITHGHIDHNNDMRLLDDLNSLLANYRDTSEEQGKLKWYLDETSYKIAKVLQKKESGFLRDKNLLYCITDEKSFSNFDSTEAYPIGQLIELTETVQLQTFQTQHIYDDSVNDYCPQTFGCSFTFQGAGEERKIAYTSDTRFFPDLVQKVCGADVLIANISSIYEDDYMLVKEKIKHLGYYGCYYLIKGIQKCEKKPKFVLISEFWNGKGDLRYDVTSQLSKELSSKDIHILPAENGMVIDVKVLKMQCSQCGSFSNNIIIKRPANLEERVDVICENCYYGGNSS